MGRARRRPVSAPVDPCSPKGAWISLSGGPASRWQRTFDPSARRTHTGAASMELTAIIVCVILRDGRVTGQSEEMSRRWWGQLPSRLIWPGARRARRAAAVPQNAWVSRGCRRSTIGTLKRSRVSARVLATLPTNPSRILRLSAAASPCRGRSHP